MRAIPEASRWVLFDTPEECAQNAAPVFVEKRWNWTVAGQAHGQIPGEAQILEMLKMLAMHATGGYCSSGRLVCLNGRYGYQRDRKQINREMKSDSC